VHVEHKVGNKATRHRREFTQTTDLEAAKNEILSLSLSLSLSSSLSLCLSSFLVLADGIQEAPSRRYRSNDTHYRFYYGISRVRPRVTESPMKSMSNVTSASRCGRLLFCDSFFLAKSLTCHAFIQLVQLVCWPLRSEARSEKRLRGASQSKTIGSSRLI